MRARDLTTDPAPEQLAISDLNVCETAGFYSGRERINRLADAGFSPAEISRVSGAVNRGSALKTALHNAKRLVTFAEIWRRTNDKI